MYVWVNKISGNTEFTLQNINILNHYIGMKAIVPDSFKELSIMPLVLGFFIFSGLLLLLTKKRGFALAWFALLAIGGTVGLTDFYMWLQNFGTDLDPAAPIQMDGMSYSPPFIGKKVLLNITASSYPAAGGIFFGVALLLAAVPVVRHFAKAKKYIAGPKLTRPAVVAVLLLLVSCSTGPQPINYGFDACDNCRMTISNNQYGAELINSKGKIFKFDAVECLITFFNEHPEHQYTHILVTDVNDPGTFIEAKTALFLQSPNLQSPMGANLSAVAGQEAAEQLQKEYGGEIYNFDQLRNLKIGEHNHNH